MPAHTTQTRHLNTLWAVAAALLLLLGLAPPAHAARGDEDDDTPPVLHSIGVSQSVVHPGGSLIVFADAEDDDSGVQSVTAKFQNPSTGQILTATLLLNSDEDILLPYSGVLKIPQGAAGTYRLISATVLDREDNQARYTAASRERPLPGAVAFTVAAPGAMPALTGCTAKASGGAVRIGVTLREGDLPTDKITLLFENPANNHKLLYTLGEEELENGAYAAGFALSPHEPAGVFTLKTVTIKDAAGSKVTYSNQEDEEDHLPLTISAAFTVRGASTDDEAPVLRSVAVGKAVREGDETRYPLTVTASDNRSGIGHITVKFVHTATGSTVSKVLRPADSRDGTTFTGDLVLDEEDDPGEYRLDAVTLADQAGNRAVYRHPDDLNDRRLPLPQLPAFSHSGTGSR